MAKTFGRFIVADPAICHGELTFRGTRVFVSDVLDQVASGMAWESIIEDWQGSLSREAIAEAVRLARAALLKHKEEFSGNEHSGREHHRKPVIYRTLV